MAGLEPEDPSSVGDYRLLGRLGVGGMGRVFLGRSPGGRKVAVKVVHAELVRRPEFRSRFRREVAAARMVSGAFTAPVIDADPDAPLPWLVTSYIAGPSLQEAVADRGPLLPDAVLALAAGLAEALKSIHAVHLVHRDLKPSNVLLAEDGPRVIDFGIARSAEAESMTRTGIMVGSPGFMSPEQVSGGEITPASDVFSLGAVLAYAATGGNPFGDGPTPALLYRLVHTEPDIHAVTNPALRELITACLAKEPGRRPTPGGILARIGSHGGTEHTATAVPDPRQWPSAADPRVQGFGPAPAATAFADRAHVAPAAEAAHTTGWAPAADTAPTHPAAVVPQVSAPPPSLYPPTRLDTTQPPPPDKTVDGPRSDGADRGTRTRRNLLLSGLAAVAVVGVPVGLHLTRTTGGSSAAQAVKPVGVWPLDERSGSSAADTVGNDDGTATGVRWRAGKNGAAEFDGVTSQIVTQGPVLRTGKGHSFTVSAWVCLSGVPNHFATAVSQAGTTDSAFYLQYSVAENRWAFSRPGIRALSYTVPAAGTWTHLVGVCDGPSRRLRLYVNGVQESAVDDANPLAAPGPLMIGRATYQGQATDFFPGAIRDVRVFDRALTSARIKVLR